MADPHNNFGYSTVATAPSPASSGTSLVVQAGDGAKFPSIGAFNATVWPASTQPTTANAEIVRVTQISTDTFTITRTQENSSARTILVGDQISDTITAKTLTDAEGSSSRNLTQSAHGFAVGNIVMFNGTSYVKAKADTAAEAEVVGIVSAVPDSNDFTITLVGYVTGLSALTAGNVYFLDPSTAGALTATAPSTIGQISKPLLIADSTTTGYFFNWRGIGISVAANNGAAGGVLAGTYPNPSLATNFPAYPVLEPGSGAIVSLPYQANVASQTFLSTNGVVYYLPLLITAACTVTAMTVRVTTAGGTGSLVRLGLFNDNAGQPGTVLLDAGTAATTSSTTTVTISGLSTALTAGRYWAAAVQQGAPSPAATFLANSGCFTTVTLKTLALAISGPTTYCGRIQTAVTGAFSTAVPSDWITTAAAQTPIIYITF